MTRVLFFHASWCHGCKQTEPLFEVVKRELENENFVFESYDVESDKGVDLSCQYQVRNVPTILVVKEYKGFKDNRVVSRITGNRTLSELFKEIRKWR